MFQTSTFRRSAIVILGLMSAGCNSADSPAVSTAQAPSATSGAGPVWIDVTEQVGLDFRHDSGATGELLLPEIMGSGAAFLDIDRDGDLDVFLVQGGTLDASDASVVRPPHRLYRNDLDAKSGRLQFTDITESSGITSVGYGMGVATGDFDNDGLTDIFVTSLGANQLYRNLGGGRFEDVTRSAGVGDNVWSSSATFFDYDRDGKLDLFVTNYVAFQRQNSPKCFAPSSARDYCGPDAYPALHDTLFHNLGNGRFENVSESAGLLDSKGAGLGVIAADFNNDGWYDVYVANDGDPNQLWINQGGSGRFVDDALLAGVALNLQGQAEAGMGVDAADIDGDGDEDLFVTNLAGESNTFYLNLGDGLFEDRTSSMGLRVPSLPFTSFGTRFLDFDHDGDLDLFAMNGAVRLQDSLVAAGDPNPLRQTSQLFRNNGQQVFEDVSRASGVAFEQSVVARGACIGDVDNDGDFDLLYTINNGPARLLLNQSAGRSNWLGLQLIDPASEQSVLQTRVEIVGGTGGPMWRRVHTDGSYQSAADPRIVVGLAQDSTSRNVTAHWPDGRVESWSGLEPNRYHVLRRGSGRVVAGQADRHRPGNAAQRGN